MNIFDRLTGRRPLRLLMDDEEEDMSLQRRPVSQCWGTPFRDIKFHDRDGRDRGDTQDRSTQTSTGPNAIVPRSEGHNIMAPQGHNNNNTLPCGLGSSPWTTGERGRTGREEGRRRRRRRRGRRRRMEERPEEERAEDSAEARIGRKLREIGDQFHQDHVQLVRVKVWMRLTMALYGFLFNREAPAVPHLRGQER
ncbi:unnamed protein product [Coregonus sp. 'balchen']|nr:unnamed protein product [Coregonus sp. 'balchen']